MGKLSQLRGQLATLKPRVAFLNDDRASASRARDRRHEYRGWYKTQRWRRLRWQVLRRDLFTCQMCGKVEPVTALLVADHKEPHRGDEALFWDEDNLWCLCKTCHDGAKQREERGGRGFGFSIPWGVRPSAVPVVLVCGPPAAGKTTWVKARAASDDLVIDLDVYRVRVGGKAWENDPEVLRRAYALRDADIRSLAERSGGVAWLIAMAPTRKERQQWAEALGAHLTVVMLATPAEECVRRVARDPERQGAAQIMVEAIGRWWADHAGGGG